MGINIGSFTKFALIGIATREFYRFGKASIEVASDLREVQNVVDVTFGSMSNQVNEFASNATKQFGLSELSAKKFTSTMGAMLKSSGLTGQTVTDMSIDLAKLSADMASFYNLENEEAFSKIMSGMSGMTQPLKELGINMNIANLENFAMAQGIKKSWQEMNQAEQTMVRYNYLLNVTADSQGDFAREAGTWANQVKILKEQWQEFMGLIGTALIEVLLPIVKGLNKLLEILIAVTKEIGKIYTLITGKKVAVQANNNIANTAMDAADGEEELADGIRKAAAAAKKAIAPFDELNILQTDFGGGGDGGTGGLFDGLNSGGTGTTNTTMFTKQVDEGPDKSKWEGFFIWIGDWWNRIKQTLSVPIMIPAPLFAAIPNPVYNPNWNLTPPLAPVPAFQPLPNPVYNPNWNLDYPQLKPLKIPAPDLNEFDQSLETMERNLGGAKTALEKTTVELSRELGEEASKGSKKIEEGLSTSWATAENNYKKHKENVGIITSGISTVLVSNLNQGLSKVGTNSINTTTAVQTNLQTFGKNVSTIAGEAAKSFANNFSAGFQAVSKNVVTFATNAGTNIKAFGVGALSIAAETARGFASNFINGLSTAWNKFKEFAQATGEKVSGWFSDNKKVVTTTAIVAGVAIGAGALALAAPAVIPYAGAALGGFAAIPALAKGGITNGPMVAMIGDNPGGREVISPLDDLRDIIASAVGSAVLQAMQFSITGSNDNREVVLEIDGTRLGRAILPKLNQESERLGYKTILQTT